MENEKMYAVEIYKRKTSKVDTRMDSDGKGMNYRTAERVKRGASINLNHKDWAIRIVEV